MQGGQVVHLVVCARDLLLLATGDEAVLQVVALDGGCLRAGGGCETETESRGKQLEDAGFTCLTASYAT